MFFFPIRKEQRNEDFRQMNPYKGNEGVSINISYKGNCLNSFRQKQVEKIQYGEFLKKQISQKRNNKIQELLEKQRLDRLEELRLSKERKLLELRGYQEKQKRREYFTRKFRQDSQIIQKDLEESNKKIYFDPEDFIIRRKTPQKPAKEKVMTKEESQKEKEESEHINFSLKRFELLDSQIFNKELMNQVQAIKYDIRLKNLDLEDTFKGLERENERAKSMKDILKRGINDIKQGLKKKEKNLQFLNEFYNNEYFNKVLERKKREIEEIENRFALPYEVLDKNGFVKSQKMSRSCDYILLKDEAERDEICKGVNFWKVLQKNNERLQRLKKYERRVKDNGL